MRTFVKTHRIWHGVLRPVAPIEDTIPAHRLFI